MGFINALPSTVSQGLIWGIMAIGLYISYKILDFADLTVDGSLATGGAICAVLVINGMNIYLAILLSFLGGVLCGIVTGLFHTALGIPSILAGILTQLMLWTVNLKIMGKANQNLSSRTYNVLLSQMNSKHALIVLLIFIVAIIAVLYWFFGTERGASIRATGCNINMSRAQGINTSLNKIIALALSNGLVALSGALLAQYQGFADISMGRGAIVIGLAAVIIGEAVVSKISDNFSVRLLGVVLGGIIYYMVYQFVIFLGLDADFLKMLSALVVAIFLGVPYIRRTYFGKGVKKKNVRN